MSIIRKILAIVVIAALCVGSAVYAEETATVTAHDFLGEWVDLNGIRNIDITTHGEEEVDGYVVNVRMDVFEEDQYGYLVWAYACVYDEETQTLKSFSRVTGTGDFEPDSEEEITDINYEYTDAEFYFNDEGMLIWDDKNEGLDDGMMFRHTIGWVDPDYVGPGHHFVGEWNDERMSITIAETMEDYQVAVTGSGSAYSGAYWAYTCDYDAETDSLVSNGEVAVKVEYTYSEDGEDYSEEQIYEDGEAVFSLNDAGLLVWDDKKENAGEGRAFELAAAEETDEDEPTGKVIAPMSPDYDLDALADGIYPAAFEPSALADGALSFSVYSEDVYDIVDISQIAPGDTFIAGGLDFVVESVERGEDLLINGGLYNGGITLWSYDEDNCWKVVMEDDYHTYTDHGETVLPLDDEVTFTDGWEIGKDPVTTTGAEAVAAAITGTDMDYFSPLNTTVRVEDGKIVEIIRVYIP